MSAKHMMILIIAAAIVAVTTALNISLEDKKKHVAEISMMRKSLDQWKKDKTERLENLIRIAERHIDNLNLKSASSPEFRESLHAARRWDRDVIGFLEVEFPAEVFPYSDGNYPPQGTSGAEILIGYYESRSKALKNIVAKVK